LRERDLPVRWVHDDGLHITLKFFGDIEPAHAAPIGSALEATAAKFAPLCLQLRGFGAFPSLRRANVLWIGIEAEPRLLALHRDLESALFAIGYPRDQRPFRPHITIARSRSDARAPDVSRVADMFTHTSSASITTMELMQSRLGPGGSRYERMLSARLSKAAS
jgi:2'-5' RNA ligase